MTKQEQQMIRLKQRSRWLMNAAEDVNDHILSNGLAYKRELLRWRIEDMRDLLEEIENDRGTEDRIDEPGAGVTPFAES